MNRAGTVLLVDDEAAFRENVAERLSSRGFEILQASEGEGALRQLQEHAVDVAILDVVMPGQDGVSLLRQLKERHPLVEVIMLTGQGSIESAVEAMRIGAYHYVTKPVRLAEIEMVVRRAIERAVLGRQNQIFREELRRRRSRPGREVVAHAPAMRRVLEEAERIAATDSSVLIGGETGTGKELMAEFIHGRSVRRERALTVLNCGALPESLLDAELFGHEKGAFTGAVETRPGLLEVSDGGTLLLDEIGELCPAGQIRLLRVLERGLVRRVGASRELEVDVRILAATHRDLQQLVRDQRFREDLFYRLHVFQLRIPPLRERREDILPLAGHFLARLSLPERAVRDFDAQAREALRAYSWPGNVRELAHAVERAAFSAILGGKELIGPEHLALTAVAAPPNRLCSLQEAQRRHIEFVLEQLGGSREKAAETLGVTERHLYRLLQRSKGGAEEDDGSLNEDLGK